jgi:molybdate transport system substrate-binding protein
MLGLAIPRATAGEVSVAVAANFSAPLEAIADAFTAATGHTILVSSGSTGMLYAQITQGAPFAVLLAADDVTPLKLERDGLAVPGTRRTYAVGRLVLWSNQPGFVDERGNVLRGDGFTHLAIASPDLAPYGAAAVQVLAALGLIEAVALRLVTGQNVAQAFQFVDSGSAELGFIARSQVCRDGRLASGSCWLVPANLHRPLRQDAVLLRRGEDNAAARALLAFLADPAAVAIMTSFGYEQEP